MQAVKIIFGVVLVVIVAGAIAVYALLRSSLPQVSGEIATDQVKGVLTIIRDQAGVPHIFADSEHDLFFGMGYCHAQDRLWQVDMLRRAALGRLSEVLGKDALKDDILLRTIFSPKSPEEFYHELAPEMKEVIEAYVAGVNYYIANTRDSLPFEFQLLRYKMEPLKPEDVPAINMVMAYVMNRSMGIELLRARLAEKTPEAKLGEIFGVYPKDSGSMFPEYAEMNTGRGVFEKTLFAHSGVLDALFQAGHLPASNCWAVSGKRTPDGKAILAYDTHMSLEIPNSDYLVHLSCPAFTAFGGSISGVPLIIEGHTDVTSWGVPTSYEDPSDFYVERINPEHPRQYLYDGKWRDMRVKKETIKVKGGLPKEIEILLTHHGPVVSDLDDLKLPKKADEVVSLRWTAHDKLGGEAFYYAMKAKNWKEFEAAVKIQSVPGNTFVYADKMGNIAVRPAFEIPVRIGFDGLKPLPGWDPKYEWKGYVPKDQFPVRVNPASGYVAAANNMMVGKKYPYYISSYWACPDRFQRITELLETGGNKIDYAYMKKMQKDVHSLTARRMLPGLLKALEGEGVHARYGEATDELKRWDYEATKESVAATIFFVTFEKLLAEIFADEMGPVLYKDFVGDYPAAINALYRIIDGEASSWVDNVNTPKAETLADLFVTAFEKAMAELETKHGKNIKAWQWGKVKPVVFYHPIGKELGKLGGLLNDGPYPIGGAHTTVNAAAWRIGKGMVVNHGPSLRYIIDYAHPETWGYIMPPGNSGNFMSSHYTDQTQKWLEGELNPTILSREQVEAQAEGKIVFTPLTK